MTLASGRSNNIAITKHVAMTIQKRLLEKELSKNGHNVTGKEGKYGYDHIIIITITVFFLS